MKLLKFTAMGAVAAIGAVAGNVIRRAGVMAVVRADGVVALNDTVRVTLPDGPHEPLLVV